MVHLATGLLIHEGRVLLVASHYPNHVQPLWNMPGGRQQPGELLAETVAREFLEETGLAVDVGELAYISESYDGDMHFFNATFNVALRPSTSPLRGCAQDDKREEGCAQDDKGGERFAHDDKGGDHVVGVEWVPIEELERRIVVGVVREPLLAYLRGDLAQRYAGFHEAGITIQWPDDSG